jgi:hypothetical protein
MRPLILKKMTGRVHNPARFSMSIESGARRISREGQRKSPVTVKPGLRKKGRDFSVPAGMNVPDNWQLEIAGRESVYDLSSESQEKLRCRQRVPPEHVSAARRP